ncbi:DNA-binding phage protein [Bradyrhizobium sp. USDA 3240]
MEWLAETGWFRLLLNTQRFDIQEHRKTLEQQTACIAAALDEDDPSLVATAIADIAKARRLARGRKPTES